MNNQEAYDIMCEQARLNVLSAENREDIARGLRIWGDKQLVVAIEEMSELQKELCKVLRGKYNNDNILEELCDCVIMYETVKQMFHFKENEMRQIINAKLERIPK